MEYVYDKRARVFVASTKIFDGKITPVQAATKEDVHKALEGAVKMFVEFHAKKGTLRNFL